MKRSIMAIGLFVIIISMWTSALASPYWYGGGEQRSLYIDSVKIAIKFDSDMDSISQQLILNDISRVSGVVTDDHAIDGFVICNLSTGTGYISFMDSVQGIDGVYLVEPYYRNPIDSAFLVGTSFCVRFDENLSRSAIDSINTGLGVVIDHELDSMPNVFVLRNTDSSGRRLLDIANYYYELPVTL